VSGRRNGRELRLATRASLLALTQTRQVAKLLASGGVPVRVVPVSAGATGEGPLDKSRFVRAVDQVVLAGKADVGVHSAKDVPGDRPDGLALAAVPVRADPYDALCGARALDALRQGARVGTSSLRRRAQLRALRPDLEITELRGNVDTRLGRLKNGAFDAVVLAGAGLERLGIATGISLYPELLPAPGQGALMLETRADDEDALVLVARVDDQVAHRALMIERAVARVLDADCYTPFASHAVFDASGATVEVFAGAADGSVSGRVSLRTSAAATAVDSLAARAVERLVDDHPDAIRAAREAGVR
jgi:hydroxymethylbilane synthase